MTQEEANKKILEGWSKERLAEEWVREHIKYNELKDQIEDLQQENEFLKLNNPEMNIEHFRIINENKRKIDNLRKQNKELLKKSYSDDVRITKAVEYIKDTKNYLEIAGDTSGYVTVLIDKDHLMELLNILQNGSDDNE